jgi:cystathionine beta-lyase
MLERNDKEPTATSLFLSETELRSHNTAKWNQYAPSVLPCWVADMDLAVAEPIRREVERTVDLGAFGYPLRAGQSPDRSVADAFSERMLQRFAWRTNPDQVVVVSELVQAIYSSILAFSRQGDGVIVQAPNYPPLRGAIDSTKRRLVPSLGRRHEGGRFRWNLDEIAPHDLASSKIFILCNPHNPTGRVFSREELEEIADFAKSNDLIVISDEIHADLVYPGSEHIPFASLGSDVAARTVTLYSATKSFNFAALRCAVMHFGTPDLLDCFSEVIPLKTLGQPGILGMDATVAAWAHSSEWLEKTIAHLGKMRDRLVAGLAAQMPGLKISPPEATYFAWIDCTELNFKQSAYDFFLERAKIAFSSGQNFEENSTQFVRLNFATSPEILDKIVQRMAAAIKY